MAELVRRPSRRSPAGAKPVSATPAAQPPQLSSELAAAVAAVTTMNVAAGLTAAPFITTVQREAVVREVRRRRHVRLAKFAAGIAALLVVAHVAITQFFYRAPSLDAVQAHAARVSAELLPLCSTTRQPLQIDTAVVSEPERIDGDRIRYVAQVTLRLRKPLYVPAVTNGTAAYRQLQMSVQAARDQELRYNHFTAGTAPELPSLPLLIQMSHRAGEPLVVRVPFIARRFGWQWKLENPQFELRGASRTFVGDSLEFYAGTPHLIFGGARTLVEIRERTKAARDYVVTVAREVQRNADVQAVEEAIPDVALAEAVAVPEASEILPAIDPNAPAVELPPVVTMPAPAVREVRPVVRR